MAEFLSWFAIVCVCTASLGVTVIALMLAWLIGGASKRFSTADKLAVVWLIYNSLTHFILEGKFIQLSLTGTVNAGEGVLAEVWKEYAKADARWGESDPGIVSLELMTVFFNGSMCLVLIHAILNRKSYRHFVQVVLNVCELYGGWMTFCPEWVSGNKNLNTSNWLYLWVYLVFFNGIWVVIPLMLLYQSYVAMTTKGAKKQS